LKNSFQGISPAKFVRKLLNVRSPQVQKFAEITGLAPFSTATAFINNNVFQRAIKHRASLH
jgi:hypothetical protein